MEFLAVVLFAITATLTPGPNNALIMGSAFNFGIRRSVPLLLGMCLGFPTLVMTIGAGMSMVLHYIPSFDVYLRIIGTLYLLYLAWKIFSIREIGSGAEMEAPLGFIDGAGFQWVNPKAWIVAVSALSSFSVFSDNTIVNAAVLSLVFAIVSIPCVGIWMVAGYAIRGFLNTEARVLWFNRTLGVLLVVTVAETFFLW